MVRSKHPQPPVTPDQTQSSQEDTAPRLHMTLRGHHRAITALQFSPDALLLASACASGWINIWSIQVRATNFYAHTLD